MSPTRIPVSDSIRPPDYEVTVEARLDVLPGPWKYNPSAWSQRYSIAIIACFAFFPAIYMGLYQWGLIDSVWDPFFDSEAVLDSDVSTKMEEWFKIPDAMFGAIAYFGDIIFAMAGSVRRWQYRPWLVLVFGLDVIPLGIVGAVLVFMQGAVVGEWCTLCLLTAVISLILVVLAFDEVWSCIRYLRVLWRRSENWRVFWDAFWGKPNQAAFEAGREIIEARSQKKS